MAKAKERECYVPPELWDLGDALPVNEWISLKALAEDAKDRTPTVHLEDPRLHLPAQSSGPHAFRSCTNGRADDRVRDFFSSTCAVQTTAYAWPSSSASIWVIDLAPWCSSSDLNVESAAV